MLTQCYEERRSLAAEKAELSMLQRRALEREQKEKQRSLEVRGRGGERMWDSVHCYHFTATTLCRLKRSLSRLSPT